MILNILSPEKRVANEVQVTSVTLPGSEGQIQILPEHADMIGTLETGEFHFVPASGGKTVHGVISSGFFEVRGGDSVTVTAETVELSSDIDVARARAAQRKAEGALNDPELDQSLFRKYELKLQRSLIRQQVAAQQPEV
jgi:F-type H+-transporting ATPase subunit epsilon